ncbi:hypothetical protein Deima_1834 [Deinococcus maricopensis DSM 21211]|uniref:Uncharacterized protein n=1 Tax=Deinococcus maricopensis (strain DSM 21211 / LMG 22137 / NRRL B-23946 / LB-34) TaxID=709986 RepID=E8U8U3_DEIML|nr:hypothetical protein Deima_1834 [Deinococcus maricopensis DSM 21211]
MTPAPRQDPPGARATAAMLTVVLLGVLLAGLTLHLL